MPEDLIPRSGADRNDVICLPESIEDPLRHGAEPAWTPLLFPIEYATKRIEVMTCDYRWFGAKSANKLGIAVINDMKQIEAGHLTLEPERVIYEAVDETIHIVKERPSLGNRNTAKAALHMWAQPRRHEFRGML